MKNHLRLITVLFLAGFVLLGQGCAREELPSEGMPSAWETANWAACRLQQQLQEQPAAADDFLISLAGKEPLYAYVRLISMPDYGLCYFIPYGNGKVEGALFYPLDSEMREDGTYLLEGNLNHPVNIDARQLNENIPITKRFLYSAQFQALQEQGMEVLPALVACAEALNGKSVPISEEESSFTPATRATNMLKVILRFSNVYYGETNSAGEVIVKGLTQEELKRSTTAALQRMNVQSHILLEYRSPFSIHFCISESELRNSPDAFLNTLVTFIHNDLSLGGFNVHIEYEYTIFTGGATGGSSGGGLSGGSSSSGKITPQGDLSKAIFNSNSRLTKQQWKKVEKALEQINQDCLGGKLIGEVKSLGIKIVHCDTMKANGSYKHSTKQLKIKNFKESDMTDREFERTLFHELIHSRQSGDKNSMMNQEIEVRIAVYMYCLEYGVPLKNGNNQNIALLKEAIDKNYNIIDQTLYDYAYNNYIEELKAEEGYATYPELPSERRNLETIQRLSSNCK